MYKYLYVHEFAKFQNQNRKDTGKLDFDHVTKIIVFLLQELFFTTGKNGFLVSSLVNAALLLFRSSWSHKKKISFLDGLSLHLPTS